MTQQLSPAAQAVLNAALPAYDDEHLYVAPMEKHAGMIAAAALRAAADHLCSEVSDGCRGIFVQGVSASAEALEEIAIELESQ